MDPKVFLYLLTLKPEVKVCNSLKPEVCISLSLVYILKLSHDIQKS